ncbi:MAG: ABC transporter permease [Chitinophagaceae bacterium]|nr:ABC transporter permease [Chitinophagaceae bacterium]
MLKSYCKIAWRNLVKKKTFSFINIGGLAIGMAVTLLIGLWIHEELTFNQYHRNYAGIAQVMQHQHYDDGIRTDKAVPIPLGTALHNDYAADFKQVVLSSWTNPHLLTVGDKGLSRPGNYMEEGAPDMLSLKMVSGSSAGLKDPSSILLSSSVAVSLFGNENAVGKVIRLDGSTLKVTGVYEDLPDNSSFHDLAFIAPWSLYARENQDATNDWNHNSFQLFAQVADGKKMEEVSARIKDVKSRALGNDGNGLKPLVFLQPMSRWHLYTEFKDGINTGGAIQYVRMFVIIGVFVLLLACINFMNLSTARSEQRAKEVGIRKAVGSLRVQLISQFYVESLLAALCAFILSLFLVQLAMPVFNTITGKKMVVLWSNPLFWLSALSCILITGLIAGSYPAMYLSSFRPIKVLKGTFKAGRFAAMPRKVLVVLQFTVAVILIIGTVVVYRQVQFARNRPLGYSNEGLIIIRPYSSDYHDHLEAIRNELMETGTVTGIAESSNSITKGSGTSGGLKWKNKDPHMQDDFTTISVSPDYGRTVGWQFVEGRDFSRELSTDSASMIINEAAVKYMGLQHPVGQRVTWNKTYTIIGVIRDVIMTSPYEPVKQALYVVTPGAGYLNFRINPHVSAGDAVGKIGAVCKKYSPAAPFDYKFADEEYAKKFADEQRIGRLSTVLAGLAIFISCLGLFGLASFIAEQRTKEIGIRKILGATVYHLWRLQSGDFLVLVMISLLIATPLAYYFMHRWLENYHYRTGLSWWVFAATGTGAVAIALLTVSFHSVRAAMSNPAESLRTE